LNCLKLAVEHVQTSKDVEHRFLKLVQRMKAAYDVCCGSEEFDETTRDLIHYYLAIRLILRKITTGEAPDTEQMNAKVREMIKEAILSEGVEEIFKLGDKNESEIDLFDEDYLAKLDKIKMPHTKFKLLQMMLAKAIGQFKVLNKMGGVNFSKKLQELVERYNERKADTLDGIVLEEFTDEIINLYNELVNEKNSFDGMGIDFEEKAFYDILKAIAHKYDFDYPEEKLLILAKEVKKVVDDKAKYTDWNFRDDIKAELKVDLIILLAEYDYPPAAKDEVYKEIFE
jgi:type I restriction enzyme R subunit